MTSYFKKLYKFWMEDSAVFPGKPTWTAADIPDLSGKVALVTGGNSGIGKDTCIELAKRGAKVYMGARNEERALAALKDIKQKAGDDAQVYWLKLDLEDLSSIKSAAKEFLSKENELHLYYQNAGVMATPFTLTKDGFENQWGTNVVGHFALMKHLIPTLLSTSKKAGKGQVRVVSTSSVGHYFAPLGGINFEDPNMKDFDTWKRYGQSKLGNILVAKEIARRYGDQGIISYSVHPGGVDTELSRGPAATYGGWIGEYLQSYLFKPIARWFFLTASEGAITQLYAGTYPEAVEKHKNGSYFIPFHKEWEPSDDAKNEELAKKTWDYLEKQLGNKL